MADVRNKVAPRRLHPRVFGVVVDEDHGKPAVLLAQQPRLTVHRQPGSSRHRPLARQQVELDIGTTGQRLACGLPRLVVKLSLAHQAELLGPPVVVDHVAVTVHDGGPQRHQGNDAFQHLRDGDAGRFHGHPLASLEHPRRQERADGDPGGQCREEQNPGQ